MWFYDLCAILERKAIEALDDKTEKEMSCCKPITTETWYRAPTGDRSSVHGVQITIGTILSHGKIIFFLRPVTVS